MAADSEKQLNSSVELFNSEKVLETLGKLEESFTAIADILDESTTFIAEENVNIPNGAIYGELGLLLQEIWKNNGPTFSDFKSNFEEWSKMISIITANNINFEDEAMAEYLKQAIENNATTAFNMDGVAEARQKAFEDAAIKTYGDNGEQLSTTYYDENGNLHVVDSEGNYSIRTVNADGSIEVKFYDKNGKELTGNNIPSAFDANGRILTEEEKQLLADQAAARSQTRTQSADEEAKFYLDKYGTDIPAEELLKLSPEAQEKYTEVRNELNGMPDAYPGSSDWNKAYNELSPEAKEALLNGSKYSIDYVTDIPAEYDGKTIVIPEASEQDFINSSDSAALREKYAQAIIDSSNSVSSKLGNDVSGMQKVANNLAYTHPELSQEQRDTITAYLDEQIAQRQRLINQISTDTSKSAIWEDGAIGDAVSYQISDTNYGNNDFGNYREAVQAAEAWNESLQNIESYEGVAAYLDSYGISIYQ